MKDLFNSLQKWLASMLGIIIGFLAIGLGGKAFTPTGLPLTRKKNITGTTAKVIGVICILLGVLFLLDGLFATGRFVSMFAR